MDKESEADKVFRDYLSRLEKGEALDLKAFFSTHGDLEEALWDRFWTWEEARSVFKTDDRQIEVTSAAQDPELFFEFRDDRGEEFGRRIDEFTLLKEIGRGTMGVVFLARQERTDRLVALKLLAPLKHKSPTARERFRREVAALGRLHHRNIVSILLAGDIENVPYFAMDLVCGVQMDTVLSTLKDRDPLTITGRRVEEIIGDKIPEYLKPLAESFSPLPRPAGYEVFARPYIEVACRFAIQLAEALEHAHSQGIMHRDVKPSNVLIELDGTCRLSDFGLAREMGTASLTQTGELVGTPYYSAPEQIVGKRMGLDRRADIFSLGVTLYELLCLKTPFQGETAEQVFSQILVKDPSPIRKHNAGVPKDLVTIVSKCLEKDPDHRYQKAGELAEDLKAFLDFRPIKARPVGPIKSTMKLVRRHKLVSAALSVAMIAILVLAGYMIKVRWDRIAETLDHNSEVDGAISLIRSSLEERYLAEAAKALGRLVSLDDSHPELESLRRDVNLLRSREKLGKVRQLMREYEALKQRWNKKKRELSLAEDEIARSYTDADKRVLAQQLATDFATLGLRIREVEDQIISAINDARTWSEAADRNEYPPVQKTYAEYYMTRWHNALEEGDTLTMEHYARLVEQYSQDPQIKEELKGLGKLLVKGTEGAEIHLFHYESYLKASRNAKVDRLVPVQVVEGEKVEPCPISSGFYAGDPCLTVRDGGLTDLAAGDLILDIEGYPAAESLLVRSVVQGSPAWKAGVRTFDRISDVEGIDMVDAYMWRHGRAVPPLEVRVASPQGWLVFTTDWEGKTLSEKSGITAAPAYIMLAQAVASRTITIGTIHKGKERRFEIGEGEVAGIDSEITAYPLICTSENKIGTLPLKKPILCAPGSYLAVLRKKGMEDLRLPICVPRLQSVRVEGSLHPEGTSPEGFVRVAGGVFFSGGDSKAIDSEERREKDLREFWISRYEVTVGEWFEFINTPEIIEEIRNEPDPRSVPYLPRYSLKDRSGQETMEILAIWSTSENRWLSRYWDTLDVPVLGVSWEDIQQFLAWKNRRAEESGSPWRYRLPGQEEWEKAARGVDARSYPWGSRFDFTFCLSRHSRPEANLTVSELGRLEPALSYPIDESPYGVRDLAGSVVEWSNDTQVHHTVSLRGGSYDADSSRVFRAASRDVFDAGKCHWNLGFRLVAVKQE